MPEEDAELTMIMQQEVKPFKETKPRLPTPFCRKRNPQNRGGNVTKKKPETKEFQRLLETHAFLQKPRKASGCFAKKTPPSGHFFIFQGGVFLFLDFPVTEKLKSRFQRGGLLKGGLFSETA